MKTKKAKRPMCKLGKLIDEWCAACKMKYGDFARRAGISTNCLQKWMYGAAVPVKHTLIASLYSTLQPFYTKEQIAEALADSKRLQYQRGIDERLKKLEGTDGETKIIEGAPEEILGIKVTRPTHQADDHPAYAQRNETAASEFLFPPLPETLPPMEHWWKTAPSPCFVGSDEASTATVTSKSDLSTFEEKMAVKHTKVEETVKNSMLNRENYKDRFVREYVELNHRMFKLAKYIQAHYAGTHYWHRQQYKAMSDLRHAMEMRAMSEGIDIPYITEHDNA